MTSDDDFLTGFETGEYRGLLFIEDETRSVEDVAEIVHAIAGAIGHDQIDAVLYVSSNWL